MNNGHIYTSYNGWQVSKFSYSQANQMALCGKQFDLVRIQGWALKQESAALKMGICVENAVRELYSTGVDPEQEYERLWTEWEHIDLKYTDNEKSWSHLLRIGKQLMSKFGREYAGKLVAPEFQKDCRIEGWQPGTSLQYIADAIIHPKGEEPILVDMKTSSKRFPDDVTTATMDNQLRTGCLVTGARRTAFLVFVKTNAPDIQWIPNSQDGTPIREELIQDVDLWLRAQREKIMGHKFHRNWSVKYPNMTCSLCDVKAACIGDRAGVEANLTQRGNSEESMAWADG